MTFQTSGVNNMAQDIQQGYVEDEQGVRAPVQTTTQTLDVVCLDSYGNETTFKIDFPKTVFYGLCEKCAHK